MPVAQGIDTSVITPVTNGVVTGGNTTQTIPLTSNSTPPLTLPATDTIPPPQPADPLPVTPIVSTIPQTPALTDFPPAAQMVAELKGSGVLQPVDTSPRQPLIPPQINTPQTPPTTSSQPPAPEVTNQPPIASSPLPQTPQAASPALAIHLANTTPTFQKPTAEQLLQHAQVTHKPANHNFIWLLMGLLITLGCIAWIVYSQMRMNDQSAPEVLTNTLEAVIPDR